MNLQRDKNEGINILAFEMLFVFKNRPIAVNWKPALPAIRHIIAGTNLLAFTNTLDVLEKTKFPQQLAGELLKDNSDILIAYLHAEHELSRNAVINFIKYMSNNDKLTTVKECEDWVRQLN
jgi:hypothetical protein